MSRETHGAALLRCLALWCLVSAATAGAPLLLDEELRRLHGLATAGPSGVPFDGLLVAGCAGVLTAATAWLWLVTTLTLGSVLLGGSGTVRGCPDGVRRVLLAACGLALVATAATAPATASSGGTDGTGAAGRPPTPDPSQVLAGLPYPDRPSIEAGPTPPPGSRRLVVRPGDTLWALARRDLPEDATPSRIDRHWRAIWRANRDDVPDPDLIHPGSTLRLPPVKES